MGTKDSTVSPYLLCITKIQETMIKQYFRRKKWKTDSFICIPEICRDIILDILEQSKVPSFKFDLASRYRSSFAVNSKQNEPECRKVFNIDDAVYQQVGIFDEVLRLAGEVESTAGQESMQDQPLENNIVLKGKHNRKLCLTEQLKNNIRKPVTNDLVLLQSESLTDKCVKTSEVDNENSTKDDIFTHYSDVSSPLDSHVSDDSGKDMTSRSVRVDNLDFKTEKIDEQLDMGHFQQVDTAINTAYLTHNSGQFEKSGKDTTLLNKGSHICEDDCIKKISTANHNKLSRRRQGQSKLKCLTERRAMFKCRECGRALASEKFYKRHMQLQHSQAAQERRVAQRQGKDQVRLMQACHICQRQCVDKYSLQAHMLNMHSNSRETHQCDLCGAVMKFKGSLVQHMKSVHTDKRPYRCDICGKHFKILQQMKNHRRGHDPNHIETCTVCGKTVKKGQLSNHLKRHTNHRPHKCSSCEKSFFEKQDLERHLRIHSGEKPFKCQHCSYASAIKGNLTKHLKHVKHKTKSQTYISSEGQGDLYCYTVPKEDSKTHTEPILEPPILYTGHRGHVPNYEVSPEHAGSQQECPNLSIVSASTTAHYCTTEEKMETALSITSMTSDIRMPRHSGIEMFTYQVAGKIVQSESGAQLASHVEIGKPGIRGDDCGQGVAPEYREEPALYTMKPVGELSYTEDQRAYSQAETRETGPQYRDGLLQYLMPHGTEIRYPYTSQY